MTATTQRRGRAAGFLILAALALLAVALLDLMQRQQTPLNSLTEAEGRALISGEVTDYEHALRRLDFEVETDAADAAGRPGEWLFEEALARAHLARGKLSGNYEDFAAAQAAINRAFAVAPPGTGPHLTAAGIAFSLHRLNEAERMLDQIDRYAVAPGGGDLAEVLGLRGDIALYRGDRATALRFYREAASLDPASADFRMAIYHSQGGRAAEADAALVRVEAALRDRSRPTRAHIALLRGIVQLDNGNLSAALERFQRANRLFHGHWLIEEHIAEVLSLTGRPEQAERMLRDVVRRTRHPEYMDALANLARQRDDQAEVLRWTHLAQQGWDRRLKLFPEAAYGHGIDHCLDAGNARCALALAVQNHRARPYGEAKLKLARALALDGRREEALAMISAAEAEGWRPADVRAAREDIAPTAHPRS